MTKLIKTSKKKYIDSYEEYEKYEKERIGIKNFRVYWRKKVNKVPENYVILGKVHRDWSGLLNSSVRFIDKLTEKIYKFIIKNDYIYIGKDYVTEDSLSETKKLVGEVMGKNIALDKWMI